MGCIGSKASQQQAAQPKPAPTLLEGQNGQAQQKKTRLSVNNASAGVGDVVIDMSDDGSEASDFEEADEDLKKQLNGAFFIGSRLDMRTKVRFVEKKKIGSGSMPEADEPLHAYTCRKGLKNSPNQDAYFIMRTSTCSIYCVFDGHGGDGHMVSDFVRKTLPQVLTSDSRFQDSTQWAELLRDTFAEVHKRVRKASLAQKLFNATCAGTTATVVMHDIKGSKLVVANVADSTCCVGSIAAGGKVVARKLTDDHKPSDKEEQARVKQAGGDVVFDGYANYRVVAKGKQYPGMAMTRALGDLLGHKEAGIIAEPAVSEIDLGANDAWLLLASDGVWEFIKPQEAFDTFLHQDTLNNGVTKLVTKAWDLWMKEEEGECVDDITAIVVNLAGVKNNLESS